MMFGWGDVFEYLECGHCGCLQIAEIPADLGKYYPKQGYYSYKAAKRKTYAPWVMRLRELRTRYYLGEPTPLGAALGALSKRPGHYDWFARARLTLDSRIADIGCGTGTLLLKLRREGFRSLLGADALIEADIDYGNGVRILKRDLAGIEGKFDFVMLHHSLEHMPDQSAAMRELRRLVAAGGTLLVRIPVCDSFARRKYGIHWRAWDPPRHLYLHTVKSLRRLAGDAGFEVLEIAYDATAEQFALGELGLRGVPYVELDRFRPGRGSDAFTEREWREFAVRAEQLNRERDGDTACFYLRPVNSQKGR
jgi:SAM-dependent methyltransferase